MKGGRGSSSLIPIELVVGCKEPQRNAVRDDEVIGKELLKKMSVADLDPSPGSLPVRAGESRDAAPLRLLVIDGGGLPTSLVETLQAFGYEVMILHRGADVLAHMEEEPSLAGVLLDVHQVVAGSMTTLVALRERFPLLPVMTTGSVAQLKELRRSIELGAAEYVVTPMDQELLKRKCAHVFSGWIRAQPVRGNRAHGAQIRPREPRS